MVTKAEIFAAIDKGESIAENTITGRVIKFRNLKDAYKNMLSKHAAGAAGKGWRLVTENLDVDNPEHREEMEEALELL